MATRYHPPTFESDAFDCPHCGVYSHQTWYAGAKYGYSYSSLKRGKHLKISVCTRCNDYALWADKKMIYPIETGAPAPEDAMPKDVKDDFLEASNIVYSSPRSAAALLRLGIQKLMINLGEDGQNINNNIGNLVKKGLPETVQQALDAVRVIGNNAVHPGELNLKDDVETALALFDLVNLIVRIMISQPKQVKKLYYKIPKGAQEAIKKRDNSA